MKEILLEVKDLEYHYAQGTHALNGISVKIQKGERIAVVGTNGAGKSTFFLNLNGVLTPTSGAILLHGRKIAHKKEDLNELRKKVGIVFQDADNQIIASTVQGEISFGPMNLKLPRHEVIERVNEAMQYMNIEAYRDRPPHYLSGGEKKRVSIADIIAMKPEMIIFDEPTACLDPVSAKMLEEVLGKLEQEGITIMVSTHDVDFAYRWAERVLVFSDGEIIADGTPLEIFKDPKILKKANQKRPMMLDVFEILLEKGMLKDKESYPKDIAMFRKILEAE